MTKILIASRKHDVHSIALAQALADDGHAVFRWVGAAYPEKQRVTFAVSNETKSRMKIGESSSLIDESQIDVVWLRRPTWAVLPSDIHANDRELALQECNHFIRSFWQTAFKDAAWVNSLEGRRAANSKLLQLRIATEVGLSVPNSLISNDPDEIKEFVSNLKEKAIVKPLLGGSVNDNDGRLRYTYTARITSKNLPLPEYIQACPCIYQAEIPKIFEVRATFFGATVVCVKIDSQSNVNTKLDWRADLSVHPKVSEIEMPPHIYKMCLHVMSKLSIIHGSFDFAVTADGEWIFFEVNEGGQFLWIESAAPQIKILDVACKFLGEPSPSFQYKTNELVSSYSVITKSEKYGKALEDDEKYSDYEELSAIV